MLAGEKKEGKAARERGSSGISIKPVRKRKFNLRSRTFGGKQEKKPQENLTGVPSNQNPVMPQHPRTSRDLDQAELRNKSGEKKT